jgi:cytochrome c1
MKKVAALGFSLFMLAAGSALGPRPALAAATRTYQVTGPVLEVRDDAIVVQKGKEKWEITRTADTKVKGDLKVGAKVTIEYRMTATSMEVKGGAAEKPAKGDKAK